MERAKALALLAAVASGAVACGLNQEGVPPPEGTLFYPASAVVDATDRWLYVSNSNADLRYNDGTVVVLNLGSQIDDPGSPDQPIVYGAEDDRAGDWKDCASGDYVKTPRALSEEAHYCCRDRLDPSILNCDERAYIAKRRTIRVGSFAAGMLVQTPKCPAMACECREPAATGNPAHRRRLFVAVRGNTSITWADINEDADPPQLKCNEATDDGGGLTECDADHRVVATNNLPSASFSVDPNRPLTRLPDEPYAMAVDDDSGLMYVGHLTGNAALPYTGGFSLFDVSPLGDAFPWPRFVNPFPSPFAPNSNGSVGITSLMWRKESGTVYATSRYTTAVTGLGTLLAATVCGEGGVRDLPAYPNGQFYDTMVAGAETRGIQFVGDRAFVLQRTPPALIEFDASHNPVAILETCSSPTFLYKHDAGRGDRLFVNCFDTGEIYVFNPVATHLERQFQIGRGPAGLVFPNRAENQKVAFVVGFGDNNISVVDLDPAKDPARTTEYHVIQRIGFPSTVPR